jgi:hypothetical protein
MTVPNTTYRVFVEKLGGTNPSQFIGDEGEVFLDPNIPALKLSNGSTPGGIAIGGTGGAANTGNITFSEERIIGDTTDGFPLGVIQLTPSPNTEGFESFVIDGQYINVYPTAGNDAPHIHITAGTLSTTSNYYDPDNGYYKGDLFLGDDSNYFKVKGNGELSIYSSAYSEEIYFGIGIFSRPEIGFYRGSNSVRLYEQGLDFNSNFAIAQPEIDYVGTASTGIIYSSIFYESQCGSMKLLVQCQGNSGNCQLSELLIVRPFGGTTVFMNETGRVTGIGTAAHVTFSSSYNIGTDQIEVVADTTTDPNNDQWSFRIVPIEIRSYQD